MDRRRLSIWPYLVLLVVVGAVAVGAGISYINATVTAGDVTLWVRTTGTDGFDCLSFGSPCKTLQGAVNKLPTLNAHRVRINMGPGTFPDPADIYMPGTALGAVFDLEGTGPTTATPDAGSSTGFCTWTAGTSPTRATCIAGSDGGWASNGLVPFYARLGARTGAYIEGTCGTYLVESNTPTVMTLEVASGTNAAAPSGCTGVLPFEIVDLGTVMTGRKTPISTAYYPMGTVGLPDGGALAGTVPTMSTRPYTLGINVGAGGQTTATATIRNIRFNPGNAATSAIRVAEGTSLTIDHVKCDTTAATVPGNCITALGNNSILVQHTLVSKATGASNGGVLIGSPPGAGLLRLRGLSNNARQAGWLDLHMPAQMIWDVNYASAPPSTAAAYCHAGLDVLSAGDVIENADNSTLWSPACGSAASALEGTWVSPRWSGSGSSGSTNYVIGTQRSRVQLTGDPSFLFPNTGGGPGAFFCADDRSDLDLTGIDGGTFSVGDAGYLADFSWGCVSNSVVAATRADIYNGTARTPSGGGRALCNGTNPADGGVLNLRAGCVSVAE